MYRVDIISLHASRQPYPTITVLSTHYNPSSIDWLVFNSNDGLFWVLSQIDKLGYRLKHLFINIKSLSFSDKPTYAHKTVSFFLCL